MSEMCPSCQECKQWVAATEIISAAAGLVEALNTVHNDPAYQSVWTISQMHIGTYRGPRYTKALESLVTALSKVAEG